MAWNRDITNFECGAKHNIEEHKWDHLKDYDCEEEWYFEHQEELKYQKPHIVQTQSKNDVFGAGMDFDQIYQD